MKLYEHIIFDLDDTLIDTSHVFWLARAEFSLLFSGFGIPESEVIDIFEKIDGDNMAIYGLQPERYGHSMLAASKRILELYDIQPSLKFMDELKNCSSIIQNSMPELIDGAIELLEWASENFNISLLTRGIHEFQLKKIRHHNLEKYFQFFRVVHKKELIEYKDFLSYMNVSPQNCWVVGDSIKSDINPAIELGINPLLYLYSHHTYLWRQEYGVKPRGEFYIAKKLSEIKSILQSPYKHQKITDIEYLKTPL